MSDYSRHGQSRRLAHEGELLITYRFPTHVVGLASVLDIEEADQRMRTKGERTWWWPLKRWLAGDSRQIPVICIPPGTLLRMTHIPRDLRAKWALRTVEDVWFTATGSDPEKYHDAIRFGNGRVLSVASLPERICFMVLFGGADESVEELHVPVLLDEDAFILRYRT